MQTFECRVRIVNVRSRKRKFIEQRNATIKGVRRRKRFCRRTSQFNKKSKMKKKQQVKKVKWHFHAMSQLSLKSQ